MKRTALCLTLCCLAACGRHDDTVIDGYVEAEFVRVGAPLSGRLIALPVERGAKVDAGAPLFVLEHESEAAAVSEAQARVERADATVRDLTRGNREEEIAAVKATLDAARAALAQSESDLKRERDLAKAGFLSSATLVAARARRDADAARVRQAQAQLQISKQGTREDLLAAARAEAQAARAALEQMRWRLVQKSVSSPAAAQVEDTLYRVGEWVTAGSPVVTLLPPGALKLRFFVPEPLLARVKPGTSVQVACDGCGEPFRATVRRVASEAEFTPPVIYSKDNRQRLLFLAEAAPSAADAQRLRPGLPVQVSLPESKRD